MLSQMIKKNILLPSLGINILFPFMLTKNALTFFNSYFICVFAHPVVSHSVVEVRGQRASFHYVDPGIQLRLLASGFAC